MNSKSKSLRVSDYGDGGGVVSATAVVDDDVLKEILLRLPAKSLIRFKSVCKHWLSLISGDEFLHLHTLRRHKPRPSLILQALTSQYFYLDPIINDEKSPMMVPYDIPNLPYPKIVSSCNGLMLLRCGLRQTDYYVYNPATKQSRKIVLTESNKHVDVLGLSLAFDPSKSPHYKIVCVRAAKIRPWYQLEDLYQLENSHQIEVYDSVSHTWNLCLETFGDPIDRDINFSDGVHCNNSIYWNAYCAVVYFDIDKNVVGSLSWPETPWETPWEWLHRIFHSSRLQESGGHLYHAVQFSDREGTSVVLSELQGDNHSEWFLKHHNRMSYYINVLRVIRGSDDDEATSTLVTHVPGKIRAYRIFDKSFQELVDLTNQRFYRDYSMQFEYKGVHQFGETLALV